MPAAQPRLDATAKTLSFEVAPAMEEEEEEEEDETVERKSRKVVWTIEFSESDTVSLLSLDESVWEGDDDEDDDDDDDGEKHWKTYVSRFLTVPPNARDGLHNSNSGNSELSLSRHSIKSDQAPMRPMRRRDSGDHHYSRNNNSSSSSHNNNNINNINNNSNHHSHTSFHSFHTPSFSSDVAPFKPSRHSETSHTSRSGGADDDDGSAFASQSYLSLRSDCVPAQPARQASWDGGLRGGPTEETTTTTTAAATTTTTTTTTTTPLAPRNNRTTELLLVRENSNPLDLVKIKSLAADAPFDPTKSSSSSSSSSSSRKVVARSPSLAVSLCHSHARLTPRCDSFNGEYDCLPVSFPSPLSSSSCLSRVVSTPKQVISTGSRSSRMTLSTTTTTPTTTLSSIPSNHSQTATALAKENMFHALDPYHRHRNSDDDDDEEEEDDNDDHHQDSCLPFQARGTEYCH